MTWGISIDPGVQRSATAFWFQGQLWAVAFNPVTEFPGISWLVVELPTVYPGQPKPSADILALRDTATRWADRARGATVRTPLPVQWKGQTPKPIHHKRILEALTPLELEALALGLGRTPAEIRAYVDAACRRLAVRGKVTGYSREDHNILDAAGLGLWHLRRIDAAGRMI